MHVGGGPWPGGAREGGLNSANLAPGLLPLPELPRYLQLCTLLCLLLAPVPSEVRIVNASQRTVGDPARDLEVSGPWCPDGDPWIPGATLSRFLMLGLLPGD